MPDFAFLFFYIPVHCNGKCPFPIVFGQFDFDSLPVLAWNSGSFYLIFIVEGKPLEAKYCKYTEGLDWVILFLWISVSCV